MKEEEDKNGEVELSPHIDLSLSPSRPRSNKDKNRYYTAGISSLTFPTPDAMQM